MSRSITGPWEYKGILNELAGNSNTNHQAIIEHSSNSQDKNLLLPTISSLEGAKGLL